MITIDDTEPSIDDALRAQLLRLQTLQQEALERTKGRAPSLAITKLEECLLWLSVAAPSQAG